MHLLRFIPTPPNSSVRLGIFTLHFYALAILIATIVGILISSKRYRKIGGIESEILDIAIWIVPAGIIGGRLYHVITTPELYFGSEGHFYDAFEIWKGGMGIWGAVALGFLVSYLYFNSHSMSVRFPQFLDAVAPGLLIAQAIGRWGNWFNGELFGTPTRVPWALEIPFSQRPLGFQNFATFQPTFLYESIWCFGSAIFIIYFKPLSKLKSGGIFLFYIAIYSLGRIWIEAIRIDPAHHIFGVRLNVWVAGISLLLSTYSLIYGYVPRRGLRT